MFYGKAVYKDWGWGRRYFTRKTRRDPMYYETEGYGNPGKSWKRAYNRQLRNGKHRRRDLKGSQWKKLGCTSYWNWC